MNLYIWLFFSIIFYLVIFYKLDSEYHNELYRHKLKMIMLFFLYLTCIISIILVWGIYCGAIYYVTLDNLFMAHITATIGFLPIIVTLIIFLIRNANTKLPLEISKFILRDFWFLSFFIFTLSLIIFNLINNFYLFYNLGFLSLILVIFILIYSFLFILYSS
ncbi:MAG: hypothetical protein PHN22_04815, partial [Candidatus ainarchaeum sp.]|nr:hypothetical protein [Candidatus ainarchaeum sp.]